MTHITDLAATHRRLSFVQRLARLKPQAQLTVFSFREEAHEPPFLDAIRALAEAHGAQFVETKQVHSDKYASFWKESPPDLLFSVNWRYLIPRSVYTCPPRGTFVFHDSLLPAYRGFSPTVWAMINGEDHTGVTLFEIADEVDSGAIVDQQRVPIGPQDTIAEVIERVTVTYLNLLESNLDALLDGTAPRTIQDHSKATFTSKWLPEDARIDWNWPARRIANMVRATTRPYPGAFTTLTAHKLTIWEAHVLEPAPKYVGRVPGRVIAFEPGGEAVVLAGEGALRLTSVQVEGGSEVPAGDVLNRLSLTLGR